MLAIFVVLALPLAFLLHRAFNLYTNYRVAREQGIPVIISPVSWQDPWWLPLQPLFEPLKNLPFGLGEWVTYSKLGWALEHRYTKHDEVGPIFATVSPRKTEFVVADPVAAKELLSSWTVWTKSPELYKLFDIFGKNVNSAPEDEWPRHRKIVSYGFKENNAKVVWDMSIKQAAGMAETWETKSKTVGEVDCGKLAEDSGTLSLHVLAAALWGEDHEFTSGLGGHKAPPGHKMSYKDALSTIMAQILLTLFFDALVLPSWLMPKTLRQVKLATQEYRLYLQEKVEAEREYIQAGGDERANLSAILVIANEKAKLEETKSSGTNRGYLSDDELYGNFFMLNLAGHETTATSISFTVALLGSHPDIQAWVREEVDAVFDEAKSYHEMYPRLTRVMALIYETLRLYGPVQNLNKYSRDNHAGQTLKVGGKTYMIPASSYVSVNFQALHTSPQFWGADHMVWNPKRWISTDATEDKTGANSNTFGEHLGGPPDGAAFVAWAMGPRECPGKKFSKVEFVASMAYMLKQFYIKPALRGGETEEMAARRLYGVVHDCKMTLSASFKRPHDAGVVLVARK